MNKLRFYLNKKVDEQMAEEFFNVRGGGIDFGKGIIKIHPQLKSIKALKDTTQRKKQSMFTLIITIGFTGRQCSIK